MEPRQRKRRSIRLKGFDHGEPGYYFVTICTQDRKPLFGVIKNGAMLLNVFGKIVDRQWQNIENLFKNVSLGAYVIMPNHIHGIIQIQDSPVGATLAVAPDQETSVGATLAVAQNRRATVKVAPTNALLATNKPPVLGDMVGAFKSLCIYDYLEQGLPKQSGRTWQRNYYEHIVRDDRSLANIHDYILDNPANWASDPENLMISIPKNQQNHQYEGLFRHR